MALELIYSSAYSGEIKKFDVTDINSFLGDMSVLFMNLVKFK